MENYEAIHKRMGIGESIANENSNWKAFTNTQRQEIIDLADVSVSADTEWEDISEPDQEDLSIHLVSQGALANADFTGFADEYVNKIKLDGLNVKNHVRETLRDEIHNWRKMDRGVRKEDSKFAGIDEDIIDTVVDMSLDKIRAEFPEEFKKLEQSGVWGFEGKANEFSLKEFKDQEDINYHTENAVALVRQYGTSDEIREVEDIALRHRTSGYGIDKQDQMRRDS